MHTEFPASPTGGVPPAEGTEPAFAQILAAMPVGLYRCDPDGRIVSFNARAAELWGQSPALDSPDARYCGCFKAFLPNGALLAPDQGAMARALRDGVEVSGDEIVVETPDGCRKTVLVHAAPLRNDSGQVIGGIGVLVDISGRQQAEQSYRESEQRFARFMQHLPGLAWIKDVQGRYVFVNESAVRAFRKPREFLLGRSDDEIFPPETAAQFRLNDDRALANDTGLETVETLQHEDGVHHSIVSKFPIPGPDGKSTMIGGMAIDFTERLRAEQALRKSEERFRLVTDTMAAAVTQCSADLRYVWVSRGYAAWLDRAPESIAGQPIVEILGQEGFETIRPYVERVLAGERVEYETLLKYKEGRARWIHAAYVPTYGTGSTPDGWVAVVSDITRLKQVEGELAVQLADLRRLHEMSVRLSTTLELQPILEETLRTAVAFDGTDLGLISLYDPEEDRLRVGASLGFDETFLEAVQSIPPGAGACGACFSQHHRIIVEDVATDPILHQYRENLLRAGVRALHSTPLITGTGKMVGVLTTHFRQPHRPSDREIRLIDLCARQAVDFIENARLYRELREADRRKDEFLATLAHELRNPLAPISNSLHILRLSEELSPSAERIREIMERQVSHMVRLVDDLLEVSRITRGKIELRKEPVEIATVIRSAVEASRPLIDEAGHQLALTLPCEPVTVEVDPLRLAQVITNLLNNAAKYMDRGGQIWLSAHRREQELIVSVRDAGVGIAAEMLPRIFDMFAQSDRTLQRAKGGLGIGLTLARQLIQMHGGRIEARSEGLGTGSEFLVRLPCDDKSPIPEMPASSAPEGNRALPAFHILVVDDARAAVYTLARLLEAMGQIVTTAHDAKTALEAVRHSRPDVVISDIGMPEMDGFELARRLRQVPDLDGTMLVALTGYGQADDRLRVKQAGFDHHLVKPVGFSALEELLQSVARRRLPLEK